MADEYAQAQATLQTLQTNPNAPRPRPSVPALLSDINGVNGRLQDLIDIYSRLRDMYATQWNKTYQPDGLRPVLEHYDYTIGEWYARVDKVRSAQRQWSHSHTLPPAADLGIPPPPQAQLAPTQSPAPAPAPTPTPTPPATAPTP